MVKTTKPDQVSPPFSGFQDGSTIPLPERFFYDLLPELSDLRQLRLLLYLFWHAEKQERKIKFFKLENMASDPILLEMMGSEAELNNAVQGLINEDILLLGKMPELDTAYYFFNSPQGQASIKAINEGQWKPQHEDHPAPILQSEKPNVFKLYEENIGVITPMMAEILKEDEKTYPISWIEKAIRIAVARNARNWKYVQAILERWQKEGLGNGQNRRNDSQDPDSYRESWLKKP